MSAAAASAAATAASTDGAGEKVKAGPGSKLVHRSITGVFDDPRNASPPASPVFELKKKPKASRRVSGVFDNTVAAGLAAKKSVDAADENNEDNGAVDAEKILGAAVEAENKVGCVIEALPSYPNESRLQWMGIEVLANWSPGCPENREKIRQQIGPYFVIFAMTKFPDDLKVQSKGCWAIANGAQDQEVRPISVFHLP